jgi:hypothetical protein
MPRLDEDKGIRHGRLRNGARRQLAATLGRNRSAQEIHGRFVRVRDENGEEVYRASLTNRSVTQRLTENCLVDWSLVTIMGNRMPPRDPNDDDDDEDEDEEHEDQHDEPAVIREPDDE